MANYPINTITDPTLQHNKTAEELIEINPKTPKFYITPKIHIENNPGRPGVCVYEHK